MANSGNPRTGSGINPWTLVIAAAAVIAIVTINVLVAALVCGFAPIVAYRIWKRMHHRS